MFRRLTRLFIPFRYRVRLTWIIQSLKLFLSSTMNSVRTDEEFEMARNFNNYLNKLSGSERLDKINLLKKGLDKKSIEEVDNFITRKQIIEKNNVINLKTLFTPLELEEQKECSKESREYRSWLKQFKIQKYNPESFYGLSGLKWLPESIKDRLQGGAFIDIGAYDGDSSIALMRAFNPQKIYSLEPQADNFAFLEHNSRVIDKDVIIPLKYGVSNEIKGGYISREENGSKLVSDENGEAISLTTIDQLVKDKEIKQIDLIKMDIEGLESLALEGAKETILRNKPILAISIYHNANDFFNIKPWLQELIPEYSFIIKKAHPFVLAHEVMLIAYCDEQR